MQLLEAQGSLDIFSLLYLGGANNDNFHSSLSIPDMLFSCTEVNLYIKKNSDLSFVVILLLFLCVLLLFKFRSIIVNQLCNHT